jgi:hypothetical protein
MMLSSVISESSHLFCVSSDFAVAKDSKYKNGSFTCALNNTGIAGIVKVIPDRVMIPNMFNNVNEYNNSVVFKSTVAPYDPLLTVTVPIGFWSVEYFCYLFNQQANGIVVLAIDSTVGGTGTINVFMNPSLASSLNLQASMDFFELIGLQDFTSRSSLAITPDPTQLQTTTQVVLSLTPASIAIMNAARCVPCFGGEPLVHVSCKDVSPRNLTMCNGVDYNIMYTMFLNTTPRGSYASFESTDIYAHDIDYHQKQDYSTVEIEILDRKQRPLFIPSNYPVLVMLRAYFKR